jgi:hypothetical protein
MVSVSTTSITCASINAIGLFGEIKSSIVTEDSETERAFIRQTFVKKHQVKGENIYNIWYKVWVEILCMILILYTLRLSETEDTIVTLKVRMDN